MTRAMEPVLQASDHSNSLAAQDTSDRVGSTQPTHFHRFPDLPKEIRQMVFEACLPRRVFRYAYERVKSHHIKSTSDLSRKPSALPWIAFVCKDAYEISKLFVREYRVDFTDIISVQWMQHSLRTTNIRFDADLDTLMINYAELTSDDEPYDYQTDHDNYLKGLHNGPHALTMSPKVNVVLDMCYLVGPRNSFASTQMEIRWLTARPYSDCLAQHSHCTVILASTEFFATSEDIRASGLFGMFGEERDVLIDIKDKAKIDQYESYIASLAEAKRVHGETYFPEGGGFRCAMKRMGAGRYGSNKRAIIHSCVHNLMYGEDEASPTSYNNIAEQDAANALYLIQQAWLEANNCFEPADNPLVPWTGNVQCREWDDEHHVAKHWLSKLPKFSFVALYTVSC